MLSTEIGVEEQLLQATIETIEASGPQSVRVRAVCEQVGVKPPSVYHYFGSREGLIDAAQARRYEQSLIEVGQMMLHSTLACSSKADYRAFIDLMGSFVFSPSRASVREVRVQVLGAALASPPLMEAITTAQRKLIGVLTESFTHAQNNGWLVLDADPAAIAVWMNSLVNARGDYEMDVTQCSGDDWDMISRLAINKILFGD